LFFSQTVPPSHSITMWARMTANTGAAADSSPFATASAAGVGALPPVQTFRFNFGGEASSAEAAVPQQEDASMGDDAPAPPARPAVQHRPAAAQALPSAAELEIVTLLPASSSYTCAPVTGSAASASASAAASAAPTAAAAAVSTPLRFLKRRSDVAPSNSAALSPLLETSDLVTQVYEGGFKLWECAIDLILFLQRQSPAMGAPAAQSLMFPSGLTGMRVVELGCGHAFPALYALQRGASYVAMQDFNAEVVEQATIDNAMLNTQTMGEGVAAGAVVPAEAQRIVSERCGFFSGDWADPALASMLLPAGDASRYDLLLTSDTLYSVAYYPSLWSLLQRLLAPGGRALVAAKRYYFGIGGSTRAFQELVRATPGWDVRVVDTVEDGKSNIREILLVQRKA